MSRYALISNEDNFVYGVFDSIGEAEEALDEREEFDIEDGCFEENCYSIKEVV